MRIAIVDDQVVAQNTLKRYLENGAMQQGIELQIDVYNDGIQLIDKYQSYYDIIYLDVEMAIMDGMTTAHKIRERDQEVRLVFVTNHAQVAIQGYSVEATDFLLKPLSEFTFNEHFKKILRKITPEDDSVMLKVSGTLIKVQQSDIQYIESQGHYIDFVTRDRRFTIIDSMKNIETKLDPKRFYRCSNSYIVNMAFVEKMDKNTVTVAGNAIQISRARKKEFSEQFTKFLGDQML
ncbi:MAG: LytTR family DNA-binding domain-containing protein [Aerococcaceae bacterium]|nr:LytTR family DNA-binding domain-containing protein [Aerococcaceae bacterium]